MLSLFVVAVVLAALAFLSWHVSEQAALRGDKQAAWEYREVAYGLGVVSLFTTIVSCALFWLERLI